MVEEMPRPGNEVPRAETPDHLSDEELVSRVLAGETPL